MKRTKNQDLIDYARQVTSKNPDVAVLKPELMEGYPAHVKLMEGLFRTKKAKGELLLPDFDGTDDESIALFSDYGGESPDAKYYTYTVLICGWNSSHALSEVTKDIRIKHGLGDKEISFKDLRYGPISRALDDYLRALDTLVTGLIFTIVVDKSLVSLFSMEDKIPDEVTRELEEKGFGRWKPRVAEKLLRVVHASAYLTGLLAKDGHKLLWMSDNDAIAPNSERMMDAIRIYQHLLPAYTDNEHKRLSVAVPFKVRDIHTMDLLSATDLVAGAVEHYLTRRDALEELTVKSGADKILKWLAHQGVGLKKTVVQISKREDGFQLGELVFHLNETPIDVQVVHI